MFEVACRCHLLACLLVSLRFLFGFYWPRPCPSVGPSNTLGACCREFAMYDHSRPEAGRDISTGSHFMLRTHTITVCEPLKSTLYLCTLQILCEALHKVPNGEERANAANFKCQLTGQTRSILPTRCMCRSQVARQESLQCTLIELRFTKIGFSFLGHRKRADMEMPVLMMAPASVCSCIFL